MKGLPLALALLVAGCGSSVPEPVAAPPSPVVREPGPVLKIVSKPVPAATTPVPVPAEVATPAPTSRPLVSRRRVRHASTRRTPDVIQQAQKEDEAAFKRAEAELAKDN